MLFFAHHESPRISFLHGEPTDFHQLFCERIRSLTIQRFVIIAICGQQPRTTKTSLPQDRSLDHSAAVLESYAVAPFSVLSVVTLAVSICFISFSKCNEVGKWLIRLSPFDITRSQTKFVSSRQPYFVLTMQRKRVDLPAKPPNCSREPVDAKMLSAKLPSQELSVHLRADALHQTK
jgi:hypothetical protein